MDPLYILGAGIFVFVAHLLDAVFQRYRIPDILCLMLIGVGVGPLLGWLSPKDFGQVGAFMGAVALVVILFEGGLNLKVRTLLSTAKRSLPFSIISFALTVAALTAVSHFLLGMRPWLAILAGFIMGGTSSAVVIPILAALKSSEEASTLLTVESAITDVLCIVGTVGIATGLSKAGGVETQELLLNAGVSLIVALGFGAAAGAAWILLLSKIQSMDKTLLTTLAYALVTYGIAEVVRVSGAIAALTLGVVLGNVRGGVRFRIEVKGRKSDDSAVTLSTGELSLEEKRVYAEAVFLLKAFFFFHLGLTVRPGDFLSLAGIVALLLAFIPLVPRFPAVRFLFPKTINKKEATLAWALMPRGLAAAVLAQMPVQMGIKGGEELASLVAMMVFLSISLVAFLVFMTERGILNGISGVLFAPFADPSLEGDDAALELPKIGADDNAPDTLVDNTKTEVELSPREPSLEQTPTQQNPSEDKN